MSKPPILHPFSTNTGQVLLTKLVAHPRMSMWFKFGSGGSGVPVSPTELDPGDPQDESVILVYPQLDILVGTDDTTVPTVGTAGIHADDTFIFPANEWQLVQWPYLYFNPIPFVNPASDKYIFLDVLKPQNATGDLYNLENR